jgi:hypothetical protein
MGGTISNRFDNCRPTALEVEACTEAERLFAEYLKLFPVSREAIELLERNLLRLALAAKMAASKPGASIIHADAGGSWHRDVDLMDNIYLCHRPLVGGSEYAVVEHFPANGTNEIWNRGGDAVQVLKVFAKEQRQALEFGTKDMVARTVEFLAEKYSGQDLSYLTDSFNHQLSHMNSPQRDQKTTNKIE